MIATLSSILGGFGSTFLAQVNLPNDGSVSTGLIVAFGACAILLVTLTVVSLMISIMLLINIKTYQRHTSSWTFEERWHSDNFEMQWCLSYQLFIWSIPAFVGSIILCGWIQFRSSLAAQCAIATICGITIFCTSVTFQNSKSEERRSRCVFFLLQASGGFI
jgi:hypothetical protein